MPEPTVPPYLPDDGSSDDSLAEPTGALSKNGSVQPSIAQISEVLRSGASHEESISPSNIDTFLEPIARKGISDLVNTAPDDGALDPLTADSVSTAVEDASRGTHRPPHTSIIKRQAPSPAGDSFASMRVASSVSPLPRSVTFCNKTTVLTAYDLDQGENPQLDLDGTEGDLKPEAEVSLNSREEMDADEASKHFEKIRRKAELNAEAERAKGGARKDFEDLWKFNEWRQFDDPFTDLGDDESSLDRRRQTAMRMMQIDMGTRRLVKRVKNNDPLYLKPVRDEYEYFLGATEQLRLSLGEDPLKEPTAEKMRECHQYLCEDFMIVFKALEWNDKIEELSTLRLYDGR